MYAAQAKALKKLRIKLKMSQNLFAKKMGYQNGQFISNIERGICGISPSIIKRLKDEGHDVKPICNAMKRDYSDKIDAI